MTAVEEARIIKGTGLHLMLILTTTSTNGNKKTRLFR